MRNMGGMSGDPTPDGVPERVVQATIRLLAEQGPSAIKARTVASASGLSTMAVYHHFGGIAELIRAVADRGFLPVGLPALALAMFWFAARQNRDDERFRDDD